MSTPEGKVKERVSALLKTFTCYYEMPVPSGYGKSGLDYTGCIAGRFFVVETKAGSGQPTPRQKLTMQNVENAGGRAFLVNDVTGFEELKIWLNWVTDGRTDESAGSS